MTAPGRTDAFGARWRERSVMALPARRAYGRCPALTAYSKLTAEGQHRGNPCGSLRITDQGDTRSNPLRFRSGCAQALRAGFSGALSSDTRAAGKLANFVFPLRRTPSGREAHEASRGCEHFLFSARSLSVWAATPRRRSWAWRRSMALKD